MKPLPKRVWILGWISMFADVASEMVYPIIPVFLNRVIMAPVVALGAIEGFAEAIVSFMKGWSGWHSDQTGKRVPYIKLGYTLTALGKPIIGLANATWLVLLGRSLDRFGKGLRTTSRDALLADSVDKRDYGRAYGLHRTLDTSGAFLGGVVLLVLLATLVRQLPDLRNVFLIAVIPGAISVAFTFLLREASDPGGKRQEVEGGARRSAFGVREDELSPDDEATTQDRIPPNAERPTPNAPTKPADVSAPSTQHPGPGIALRAMPKGYWRAVLVTLAFGLANSSDTFLILRANDVFRNTHPSFLGLFTSTTAVEGALIMTTLAYILYNFTYVLFSYPAGKLSDRIGRWPVFGAGLVLYAVVYAGFAYISSWAIWILFALYGVYNGLTDGVGKALVADHSPKEARGTALGFFYMGAGFMTLAANLVGGYLWDAKGPAATFLFGSVVAGGAVLLIPLTAKMESVTTPLRR